MKFLFRSVLALASLAAAGAVASNAEIANPAASFCVASGGTFAIVREADGERGVCELADGTIVDAWDHFRANWDKLPSGN